MQRVGLPDQFENLIANVELGLAEESAFFGGHKCPGDGKEMIPGLLFQLGGELLGLRFLFRGKKSWHGILPGE